MDDDWAIRVTDLGKCYCIYDNPRDRFKQALYNRWRRLWKQPERDYYRVFWALKELSFSVAKGEIVGIVGRNGSGKSTLLQLICGILQPTTGTVEINGRIAALLELGAGFNPEFSGRENVYLNGALFGLSNKAITAQLDEIIAFSELGEFIDQPVKSYSSGMYARLGFAVSIALEPEILVVDEALAVGDAFFQAKCLRRLDEFRRRNGTVLLVSHDIRVIERFCTRSLLLHRGKLVYAGENIEVINRYYRLGRPERGSEAAPVAAPQVYETIALRREHTTGDGSAYIECLSLCDDEGISTTEYRIGEWLNATLTIRFDRAIEEMNIAVGLRDKTGALIGGAHTYHGEIMALPAMPAGGRMVFATRIRLDLAPGEYLLLLAIANNVSTAIWHEYCAIWDCAKVTVYGEPKFWGMVYLPNESRIVTLEPH